jgi:ROK family
MKSNMTTNQVKKNRLRQILFTTKDISRNELAEQSGLNMRTVIAYVDELKKLGAVAEETVPNGKGRPAVYYRSKAESMVFMGVMLAYNRFHYQLIDINRYLLYGGCLEFDLDRESSAQVITRFIEMVKSVRKKFPERLFSGIGIAVAEYRLDPRADSLCRELLSVAGANIGVPVLSCNADTVMLYRMGLHYDSPKTMAVIHPADELRMGLLLNGKAVYDVDNFTHDLRHVAVDPKGEKCYCGNRGCLGSLVTHGATLERFRRLTGKTLQAISDFRYLLGQNDPGALQIAHENGVMLAQAISYIEERFKPERIYLDFVHAGIIEIAKYEYRKNNKDSTLIIDSIKYSPLDCIAGAAEMALYTWFGDYFSP